MKFHFEKNLKKYTETYKESLKELREGNKLAPQQKRTKVTEDIAKLAHTTPEAEAEIYDIQKKKLEKLNKFKKFLEKTRDGAGGFKHGVMERGDIKTIGTISHVDGVFQMTDTTGNKAEVTLGEIMTDSEWDNHYTFDDSVNIHDIRQYYLGQLKSELRDQLDRQIIISETSNTRGDTFKQNAYRAIGERLENGSEQGGVIAEKMVKNFLKKLAIDADADFEIVDADAHQDVDQKIDFIIHRKAGEKNRGARVEQSDARDIGIQFTMNTSKTSHKEHQIQNAKKHLGNDIDDIVLVTLPIEQASHLYKKWSDHKTPGGPEKSWSTDVQETIFRGVMQNVLSQDEIDEFCERNFK
jgi:hypothetical protein